ncbi:MAG: hypothetical protein FJ087_03440 [Deltaproteobacteria bacterium]|nr:hypothetical protein [Deltaproteobacteria bacterium]
MLRKLVTALAVGVLAPPGWAAASDQWDRTKGNCDAVFQNHEAAELPELKYCMGMWEAYRDVVSLNEAQRLFMAKVFNRLYKEGDAETRHVAKNALARLGFAPKAASDEDLDAAKAAAEKKPERKKYRPLTADPGEQKLARTIREQGMKLYKKKDWAGAVERFNEALSHDGQFVQALYDAACCYGLMGDAANAGEYLLRLSDIGSKEALKLIRKARVDKDFEGIRDDPGYKRGCGYARIKVVNGMPADDKDAGEGSVVSLVDMLNSPKLQYKAEPGGDDKHTRDRPHVWYKEHAKNPAYIVAKVIGHPRTRLVKLDWESDWDMIVSWADKVAVNADGERTVKYSLVKKGGGSGAGVDPEKRMDEALREEDKALREPDKYARQATHVLETPDRMANKVDSAKDRVDGTVNTVENVGDKAKALENIGDKFK